MTWVLILAVLAGVVAVCVAILSEGDRGRRVSRR
jgi:hypothetical protein